MADKIKKFFQKKKTELKFKTAGPGRRLNESSSSSGQELPARPVAPPRRMETTEERRLAAEAALSRLNLKRDNPQFNTSISAIRAQVKKELEAEKATSSSVAPEVAEKAEAPPAADTPTDLVTSGVYFRCPLISNAVLSKEEWKTAIREFLYEQLSEERGLTACLIIQSCNGNREKVDTCVATLCKYLENLMNNPDEEKFRKIRMSNRAFTERVLPIEGALELLAAAGFARETAPNQDGVDEEFLVVHDGNMPTRDDLEVLTDALRSASPIQLELDRGLRVLYPSQAAADTRLPDSFYTLSGAELKREQMTKSELAEKSLSLRTRAMRERDARREARRYRYACVRVRLPDGIALQGTFGIYETYAAIHEFVQENLEHNDLPFILTSPLGKLSLEEDGEKTLVDLNLVPTSVLVFSWHPSVIDQIKNSPNSDVYLKPEVMMLVQSQ